MEKLYKIINLLQKVNVSVISVYVCKSKIKFLLCVDVNGLFFLVNVKAYNITSIESNYKNVIMKLLDNSEIGAIYSSMKYYEQFVSLFPKFRDKLVYHIDDFLIFNSNNVYRILKDSSYAGNYGVLSKFDLEYLYDNKYSFSSEIYTFNDELLRKVKEISSSSLSENISTAKFCDYFKDSKDIISSKNQQLQNLQSLFTSINSFSSKLKKDLKTLDDYTSNSRINLYETNKNIQDKIKMKQKMKNMDNLRMEVIEKMGSSFFHMMHKIIVYIFYKNELDKKYIGIESTYSDFIEKFS